MKPNNNKTKKKKNKKQSIQKSQVSKQQPVLIRILKSAWFWIVVFLTLIGGYISIDYFWPDTSIYPSRIVLNKKNPFKNPFVISNKGNFSVYNFDYSLKLQKLKFDTQIAEDVTITNSNFDDIHSIISEIKPSEKYTISLMPLLGIIPFTNIDTAQIVLKYSYKPYMIPDTLKDSTRYVLFKDFQNKYVWIENPFN
jgi:hypothetical protein